MKLLAVFASLLVSFAVSAQTPSPAVKPSDMQSFTLNGFELSGSEYWVIQAGKEFIYPDDVIWDFTGNAPQAAQECAMKAYNKLLAFLTNPPANFVELKAKGATPRFYLWTNDYTTASAQQPERPTRFWHWNRGDKDYAAGYWKWESSVTHQGVCTIPQDQQIADMILEVRRKMGL
jgi:hypothetical protein